MLTFDRARVSTQTDWLFCSFIFIFCIALLLLVCTCTLDSSSCLSSICAPLSRSPNRALHRLINADCSYGNVNNLPVDSVSVRRSCVCDSYVCHYHTQQSVGCADSHPTTRIQKITHAFSANKYVCVRSIAFRLYVHSGASVKKKKTETRKKNSSHMCLFQHRELPVCRLLPPPTPSVTLSSPSPDSRLVAHSKCEASVAFHSTHDSMCCRQKRTRLCRRSCVNSDGPRPTIASAMHFFNAIAILLLGVGLGRRRRRRRPS